ncbi:hypothetical protein [Arthrobacter psychrolactophilus]
MREPVTVRSVVQGASADHAIGIDGAGRDEGASRNGNADDGRSGLLEVDEALEPIGGVEVFHLQGAIAEADFQRLPVHLGDLKRCGESFCHHNVEAALDEGYLDLGHVT